MKFYNIYEKEDVAALALYLSLIHIYLLFVQKSLYVKIIFYRTVILNQNFARAWGK